MADNSTIERGCNYDYSSGDSDNIFGKAFPLNGVAAFSIQIFVANELAPGSSARFILLVSNDTDLATAKFAPLAGTAIFPYQVVKTPDGFDSCFLLCGNVEGAASCLWARVGVRDSVAPGNVTKGIFSPTPLG